MAHRSVRFLVVICGLLATTGLGYRGFLTEQRLVAARQGAAAHDRAAGESLLSTADLRAALHAYVAAGQDIGPWARAAGETLDALRQRLLALDEAAVATGNGSMANALDAVDQLAAAEKHARAYVTSGQELLAGDVIFTEARDLLDTVGTQVVARRDAFRRVDSDRADTVRREQAALAAGAVALWVLVALLLVPSGNSKEHVRKSEGKTATVLDLQIGRAPETPAAPGVPEALVTLVTIAEVCGNLSTLSDVGALGGALAQASQALGATGMIVWVASGDGHDLAPLATHGYDARLVARIGTIGRDSANLTAAAFRDAAPRISAATDKMPAAIACALIGPSGPVGVLSAELRSGTIVDESCMAMAAIFAAQLAMLAPGGPASPSVGEVLPQQAEG